MSTVRRTPQFTHSTGGGPCVAQDAEAPAAALCRLVAQYGVSRLLVAWAEGMAAAEAATSTAARAKRGRMWHLPVRGSRRRSVSPLLLELLLTYYCGRTGLLTLRAREIRLTRLGAVKIAIAGGTGVVGSYAADAAEAAGHDVVVLTRHSGVDVMTGEGLTAALDGVDVVIDTLNLFSLKGSASKRFFTTTARNLQEAGHRAGVRHIVTLSIVAIDRVPG